MKILSEQHDPKFLVDNIPIRQLYDQAHQQISSMIKPINTPARTPSRRLGVTPIRAPVTTVCSKIVKKFQCEIFFSSIASAGSE